MLPISLQPFSNFFVTSPLDVQCKIYLALLLALLILLNFRKNLYSNILWLQHITAVDYSHGPCQEGRCALKNPSPK